MKKILFTLISLLIICLQSNAQTWSVTELAIMPEPVTNNAVCEGFVNGVPYVYSFGGLDSTKLYSGIHLRSFRYNTQTDTWEQIPDLPDTLGKIAAAANRVEDTIYIIGGYHVFANGNELSSNKVHRFDVNANVFLADGADIPIAIDDHVQAVWRDSLIFVVTGWSNTTNVANVQIYNPYSDVWTAGTSVPSNSDYKSFGASGEIIDDTIYYFGGTRIGFNFPAQNNLRKGVINPNDPTQITWSDTVLDVNIKGYRMAATTLGSDIFWFGGSDVTYNYNGIAYNGSGGVDPTNRELWYSTVTKAWDTSFAYNYPMDLRGIAETNQFRYIAGGMLAGQEVSNKLLQLNYAITNTEDIFSHDIVHVYPNPTQNILNISLKNPTIGNQIKIFTAFGQLIDEFETSKGQYQINTENYLSGVYFLQVVDKNKIASRKFVISK
ncbi:MAG: hypothetical protein COA57_01895 [Flavobacteriales bacterium]|nr:MAG: hypothetical protein COA57_01895 [Flavobacteriales bacterium]